MKTAWSLEIYGLAKFLTLVQTDYVHIFEIYIVLKTIPQKVRAVNSGYLGEQKIFLDKFFF